MYHFRSPNRPVMGKAARAITATLLGSAALLTAASPAFAARSQAPQTRQEISQTRLAVMKGSEVTRIDWRQPEMKLKFDLTESDWIDDIDLILSMTPQGDVSKRGPVLVSLNNSAPLKMHPYGQSFDARLRFDESFIRAKGNVITIRVPAPDGAPCLTSKHGHWDVNTKKSSIVVRTRAKSRNYYLREVSERLKNPATAPKTVSLLASGGDKARLQMLAAQGLALQTADIPNFKTTAGRADMEIIIARRDQLAPRVTDRSILSETGPKISVHKGRPMRLVITGDTDAEVLKSAKAFASHELPAVRRRETSSGEVSFQTAFSDKHTVLSGKTRFTDISDTIYAMDWRGTPNTLTFNVSDPSVTSGNVLLRLSSGPKIAKDSRVEVELNGQSLGFTTLDRSRKSVNFDIPEGALHGVGNTLKIVPQLDKNPSVETFGQSCPLMDDLPGFFIGNGSRIELSANEQTPLSELSRLTSDGSLFAQNGGANTHIVLTSGSQNDISASLELLAKLAKSSGSGWTNATVSRKAGSENTKNLLILGPNAARTGLLGEAPRSLTAALKGKSSTGAMVRNFGDYEKFASADAAKTMRIYAAKTRAKTRIRSGGVAAVYPDNQRLVGVISSTPGRTFASVTQDLIEDGQWNNLSGSVARWNSKTVLMAQTAIPTPNLAMPKSAPESLPRFDVTWLEDSVLDVSTRMADLKDAANVKLAVVRSKVETRFAGTLPAKGQPKFAAKEPTPVYVSKKTQAIASNQTLMSRYKSGPPVMRKTAAVQTAALVAPLRGFSQPEQSIKADSRAPKWLTELMAKFQKSRSESTRHSPEVLKVSDVNAPETPTLKGMNNTVRNFQMDVAPMGGKLKTAIQSDSNPMNKLLQLTDRNFGFFSLLMALAFLTIVLMLGLVKPANEDLENY